MAFILKVDHREPKELKDWLSINIPFQCVFENLPAGDFEFIRKTGDGSTEPSVLLIERKEIADLCASLTDGRFDEQKHKLSKSFCAQPRPISLLIEGNYRNHEKEVAIDTITFTTQFRDGLFVLRSEDVMDTGRVLHKIATLFLRDKFEPLNSEEQHQRFISARASHRGVGQSRKTSWWELALSQIDGVGPKVAQAIASVYPTAGSLITALEAAKTSAPIANIMISSESSTTKRKVGVKIAEKIRQTITVTVQPDDNANTSTTSKKPQKKKTVKTPASSASNDEECRFVDTEDAI
jgi:ERCC4-type nuclease